MLHIRRPLARKLLSFKTQRMTPMKGLSGKVWDRNGFSVAELLVVVAVVAILALIVIPLWVTYLPAATLSGAARQVQAGLNQARLLAISTRQNICVQLVPGGYQFRQNTCAGPVVLPPTALGADSTGTFRPATSNTFTLAGPSAIFTPFATASQTAVLTITGPQARTLTVTVLPSGQVTIP